MAKFGPRVFDVILSDLEWGPFRVLVNPNLELREGAMACSHTKRNDSGMCVACGDGAVMVDEFHSQPTAEEIQRAESASLNAAWRQVSAEAALLPPLDEGKAVKIDPLNLEGADFYALGSRLAKADYAYEVTFETPKTRLGETILAAMRNQKRGDQVCKVDFGGGLVDVFRGPPPDGLYFDPVCHLYASLTQQVAGGPPRIGDWHLIPKGQENCVYCGAHRDAADPQPCKGPPGVEPPGWNPDGPAMVVTHRTIQYQPEKPGKIVNLIKKRQEQFRAAMKQNPPPYDMLASWTESRTVADGPLPEYEAVAAFDRAINALAQERAKFLLALPASVRQAIVDRQAKAIERESGRLHGIEYWTKPR